MAEFLPCSFFFVCDYSIARAVLVKQLMQRVNINLIRVAAALYCEAGSKTRTLADTGADWNNPVRGLRLVRGGNTPSRNEQVRARLRYKRTVRNRIILARRYANMGRTASVRAVDINLIVAARNRIFKFCAIHNIVRHNRVFALHHTALTRTNARRARQQGSSAQSPQRFLS